MIEPSAFITGITIEAADPISFTLNLDVDFTTPRGLSRLNNDKREQVKKLTMAGSIEILFFYFLAYHYEDNYIILNYSPYWRTANFSDKLKCNPINYVNYDILDSEFIYNSQTESEYKENTSILFNDGHYVIFYNDDLNVEHNKIYELRNIGEPLWKNPFYFLDQSQVSQRSGVSGLSYLTRRGGHLRKGKKHTLRKGKKHTLRRLHRKK